MRRSLTGRHCNTPYKVLKIGGFRGHLVGEEGFALASDGATFGNSGKALKRWIVGEY